LLLVNEPGPKLLENKTPKLIAFADPSTLTLRDPIRADVFAKNNTLGLWKECPHGFLALVLMRTSSTL
jgi:hypothetical protein